MKIEFKILYFKRNKHLILYIYNLLYQVYCKLNKKKKKKKKKKIKKKKKKNNKK